MRRTRGRVAALLLAVLAGLSLGCSRSTSYRTIPLEDEVEWQEEGTAELLVDGRLDTDGYFRGTVRANIAQKEMRRWAKRIESQDYIPGEAFTGEWTLDMLEEVGDEWNDMGPFALIMIPYALPAPITCPIIEDHDADKCYPRWTEWGPDKTERGEWEATGETRVDHGEPIGANVTVELRAYRNGLEIETSQLGGRDYSDRESGSYAINVYSDLAKLHYPVHKIEWTVTARWNGREVALSRYVTDSFLARLDPKPWSLMSPDEIANHRVGVKRELPELILEEKWDEVIERMDVLRDSGMKTDWAFVFWYGKARLLAGRDTGAARSDLERYMDQLGKSGRYHDEAAALLARE